MVDIQADQLNKSMYFDQGSHKIWKLLDEVKDPEIPVLSLRDLGVLRGIDNINGKIIITITPTYSACPAMDVIRDEIRQALVKSGYPNIEIRTVLSPAWTTDWITEEGKQKLEKFGIAPPCKSGSFNQKVICPKCRSANTVIISEYGSTACQSLYRCDHCQEPFCYFKAI